MAENVPRTADALERPVDFAVAAIALLGLPKLLTALTFREDPTLLAGLAVMAAVHVLIAVDCLWVRRLIWVVAGLAVVATLLIVGGQLFDGGTTVDMWRTDAWFATPLAYALLISRRRGPFLTLAATAVGGLVVMAWAGHLEWEKQFLGLVFTASGIGVLWVARLVTVAIAEDYLASRAQRAEQAQVATETAARAEALASLRREMHDSLLHALQRMGASWSAASPGEIRDSCREASRRLSRLPDPLREDGPVDVGDLLRRALSSGRQVVLCEPAEVMVPQPVAHALVGAAREAVRNAQKYASGIPEVLLRQRGDSVRLSITDEGPGFDVTAQQGRSLGLEGSVVQRMTAVGGEARLSSGEQGTTVELRWPASAPRAHGLGRRARRLLAWLPAPLTVASLVHVTMLSASGPRWPVLLALLVAVFIGAGAARMRYGGLAAWQAVGLCAVGMGAFVANYVAIQGVPSTDWDLWAPGLVSALLVISLTDQPPRLAVPLAVLVLAAAVLVSGLTVGWGATLHTHFGGILAVLLYTVVTMVLVLGAEGVSRHLHVTRRLAAAAALREQAARVRDAVWLEWLAHAQELTGAFLDDVAEGRRDPADPQTRATAARLGARMRDELRLWPGSLVLAEELDRLRGLGWDARLLSADVNQASAGDLTQILGQLGAPAEQGGQLLVTAEGDTATVTLTPAVPLAEHEHLNGWVSIDDPDFTQLKIAPAREGVAP